MIEEITITGYKSLGNSHVVLKPFSVIVGKNNTGKSNLFDALKLLSCLGEMTVNNSFKPEHHRGDPIESFFAEDKMWIKFVCEFDLRSKPHPFKNGEKLTHPWLRYEIEIAFNNKNFMIVSEKLNGRKNRNNPPRDFVSLEQKTPLTIMVNRDGAVSGKGRHFPLPSQRSVLTMIDDAELYPHVVALSRELSSWRFFHFEPEALRESTPVMDVQELETSGRGLSGFYDTLANKESKRFEFAQKALTQAIPEARGIKVLDTGDRRRLLAIERKDGRSFTARVLSDGTLRFLALLALAYAPEPPGLVCFEEPENGVHPAKLPFIIDMLRGLSEQQNGANGGAQVLLNSHSPYLVDLLNPAEMLVAFLDEKGNTHFNQVENDLLNNKESLKKSLEDGEQTLGEIWSQGSFDSGFSGGFDVNA